MHHPDQAAKIEQLLLTGLDAYFAGQHDLAISVWTRVLFLDRTHARARAYIERARSALAERQRESEALLHQGVDAFQRGDRVEARRLLEEALSLGAPAEEARTVLDRIHDGRFLEDVPGEGPARAGLEPVTSPTSASPGNRAREYFRRWPALTMGGIAVAACVIAALAVALFGWRPAPLTGGTRERTNLPSIKDRILPLPPLGELAVARARRQAAEGRLRDAMATLTEVGSSDAARAEADRYRAELQRQLLALVPGTSDASFVADRQTGRP